MRNALTILCFLLSTSIVQAGPEGHAWEFGRYIADRNTTVIVRVDLQKPNVMKAFVTCYAHASGEVARSFAEGQVLYSENQIINNGANDVVTKVPFNNGFCFAAIPAGRVMTYSVIDSDHLTVTGDPFFPNPTIWTKVK